MSDDKFHFCIARKWRHNEPLTGDNICAWIVHQRELNYGTQEYAESCLQYPYNAQKRLPESFPSYEYFIVKFKQEDC